MTAVVATARPSWRARPAIKAREGGDELLGKFGMFIGIGISRVILAFRVEFWVKIIS